MIPELHISDYSYNLADDRIAKYPLPVRDSSKLLHYDPNNGKIADHIFNELPSLLPESSIMVFNDTKVVPARLHFKRATGALIEIFCLEPYSPNEYNLNFACTSRCKWKCIVGNVKRWKDDLLSIYNPEENDVVYKTKLTAKLVQRDGETSIVEFSWANSEPFSKILEICGAIPIPPYLNRNTEDIDYERYQTMYAKYRGSVAAPTAGLHFTDDVLNRIKAKGIDMETVCLHVGAGTFLPVKNDDVREHIMHREPFAVSLSFLKDICRHEKNIIAVGTTSVRTVESLYYVGVHCIEDGCPHDVDQWEPYTRDYSYTPQEAVQAIIGWMEANGKEMLNVGTRIIIVPGFEYKFADMLVTNFHQPQSTLLLLVSAFVGGAWRPVYDHALESSYRFLSYGDSSLLVRKRP